MEQDVATYTTSSGQAKMSISNFWATQSHLMTKAKLRQETRISAAHITEELNQIYSIQPSRLSRFWQRLQFHNFLSYKW